MEENATKNSLDRINAFRRAERDRVSVDNRKRLIDRVLTYQATRIDDIRATDSDAGAYQFYSRSKQILENATIDQLLCLYFWHAENVRAYKITGACYGAGADAEIETIFVSSGDTLIGIERDGYAHS